MPITLCDIQKYYGEKLVFQGFSHVFPDGTTTSIMGPSGCGKTTLLRILLGLEQPQKGQVLGLEGRKKSAVFQEDRLCENISPLLNLRLVAPGLSLEEGEKLLGNLGLSDCLFQPVSELSGGMKRRVAILRALCAPYDVLFADEPFRGLDEKTKLLTMKYFQEQTRGKTVICVTHDEKEAAFLGGEILKL